MVLLSLAVDAAVFEIELFAPWSMILQAELRCSSVAVSDDIILGFSY